MVQEGLRCTPQSQLVPVAAARILRETTASRIQLQSAELHNPCSSRVSARYQAFYASHCLPPSSLPKHNVLPQRQFVQAKALPSSVAHLVVVSAVPVAYPEVSHMEKFMSSLENKNNLLVKTGTHSCACIRCQCCLGSFQDSLSKVLHMCLVSAGLHATYRLRGVCLNIPDGNIPSCDSMTAAGVMSKLMNQFGEPELLDGAPCLQQSSLPSCPWRVEHAICSSE